MSNRERAVDNNEQGQPSSPQHQQAMARPADANFGLTSLLPVLFIAAGNRLTPSGGSLTEPGQSRHPASKVSSDNESSSLSITMPCGARGMPWDHNSQNAFFTVHQGTKHGDELVCSYPQCRAGGVKFCYCAHCNMPVAKRNFRVRHHHSDEEPTTSRNRFAAEPQLTKPNERMGQHHHNNNDPVKQDSSHAMERLTSSLSINGVVKSNRPTDNQVSTRGDGDRSSTPAEQDNLQQYQQGQKLTQNVAGIAARQILQGLWGLQTSQTTEACLKNLQSAMFLAAANNNSNLDSSAGKADQSEGYDANKSRPQPAPSSEPLATNTASVPTRETRFPCRARGMPPQHCIETAYFDVRDDIKHGDELVCSFPGCRNAGVKFCFCTHCKIPVAKRNFRIRHNHCDYAPPAPSVVEALGSAALPVPSSPSNRGTARCPHSPSNSQLRRNSGGSVSTSSSRKEGRANKKRKMPPSPQTSVPTNICPLKETEQHCRPSFAQDFLAEGASSPISDDDNEEITTDRMEAWDNLLQQRPNKIESTEMAAWLMSVLAVSNVEVPVEETAQPLQRDDVHTTSRGIKSTESQGDSDLDGDDIKWPKRPRI